MAAVEVTEITRKYRSRLGLFWREVRETDAVRGVSFHIEPGEMFGLLGPNGAGKTTIIKVLTTLLLPTSGRARVMGHDVAASPGEVRKRIGYVFGGDRGLYDRLSVRDNLRYFAELYGVPHREQRQRIGRLLDQVGLADRQRERVENLSRGMRQRLHIARGLLHDPPVLFLDEPSIGIDPVGARELRSAVSALAATGKTVLLTTHYMYEADELCDRIAIIKSGLIVAAGSPASLKARAPAGHMLEVEVHGLMDGALERVRGLAGVRGAAAEDRGRQQVLLVRADDIRAATPGVLRCLDGMTTGRVWERAPTLEDAYIELVGRA